MKFYTNISQRGDNILVRGYENGQRFNRKIPYKPYLFIQSDKQTDYKSLDGISVDKLEFDSLSGARNFIKRYSDVSGFSYYGLTNFMYVFINDYFPGEIQYDSSLVKIVNIDIEVAADDGFPSIEEATKPVTAVTMSCKGKYLVLGVGEFETDRKDVVYIKCYDEDHLLRKFLEVWTSKQWSPDIVTGWNVEFFDIPYMVNRIRRVLGQTSANKISPWNIIGNKVIEFSGNRTEVPDPVGLTVLDYLPLYRKFSFTNQESYRLDNIANIELGEKKLDYSEFDSLLELYKKDYQKFIEYNIKDVELVDRLDDKLKFIEQVLALAYNGKVNYIDTFRSVRMWDVIIHNYLMKDNIVVPQAKVKDKERQIEGAFVKEPQVGMHKWVVSFDLNSLYPHLIMQYNISPETYVNTIDNVGVENILSGKLNDPVLRKELIDSNLTICPTGCTFDKDYRGFLPKLMSQLYDDRTVYKKRMIEAKKEYEKNPSKELEAKIAQNHNMQLAKKIQLNSAYGALGNNYFRWFDPRYAESITMSGQLSIRWMENKINEYLNKIFKTEQVDYVLACDTDSMYITLDKLVNQVYEKKTSPVTDTSTRKVVNFLDRVCREKLEPFIDSCYKELAEYVCAYEQKMFMKRENIADKAIWTAKKRYIMNVHDSEGVRYDEPKLKIMGIEAVRSSTPAAVRQYIREALKLIMSTNETNVQMFIKQCRENFKQLPFEDIAFPRGCRGLDKYTDNVNLYKKGTPIHVKGALVYNELLKRNKLTLRYEPVRENDKIKFCYLRVPNPTQTHVISVPGVLPRQLNLEQYIDYDMQFDKAFIEPIKHILDAIDWKVEKIATLEDFWS